VLAEALSARRRARRPRPDHDAPGLRNGPTTAVRCVELEEMRFHWYEKDIDNAVKMAATIDRELVLSPFVAAAHARGGHRRGRRWPPLWRTAGGIIELTGHQVDATTARPVGPGGQPADDGDLFSGSSRHDASVSAPATATGWPGSQARRPGREQWSTLSPRERPAPSVVFQTFACPRRRGLGQLGRTRPGRQVTARRQRARSRRPTARRRRRREPASGRRVGSRTVPSRSSSRR